MCIVDFIRIELVLVKLILADAYLIGDMPNGFAEQKVEQVHEGINAGSCCEDVLGAFRIGLDLEPHSERPFNFVLCVLRTTNETREGLTSIVSFDYHWQRIGITRLRFHLLHVVLVGERTPLF